MDAKSLEIHPQYRSLSADADIAIVTLRETVEFMKFIKPICLSTEPKEIIGETGTVAGWGKNEHGDFTTEEPKKVAMPVVSQDECIKSSSSFKDIISKRTFCAGI